MENGKHFVNSSMGRRRVKYLDPKADLTFKLVFGEHPDLVMSLLNALLPLDPDGQITEVQYLSPEMVPDNPGKKYSVVDVRCRDQQGRQFIVEMQLCWNPYFKQRVILNASKAVVRQLDRGMHYSSIQPVYCLCLLNEAGLEGESDEFYHDFAISNTEHPERRIEGLRFIFVELPKFKPKTMVEKKMAVLWLRFLTEIDEKSVEVPSELLDNELTNKALGIVEESAMSEDQLYAYERFWLAVQDEQAFIEGGYLKGFKKGQAEGRARGEAEGRAEGRAEGEADGRESEKLDIAKRMKAKGMSVSDIAEFTQLTVEAVNDL